MPTDAAQVAALQQALGIPTVLCQLLVQRGITSYDQAYHFFRPQWTDLHDPLRMRDMDRAVDRVRKALQYRENILIYGDYDVDGTTGVTLLYDFLRLYHPHLSYYLPDRHREGYGISLEGIEHARQQGVHLLIAVDCGIQAHAALQRARGYGIDCIVCDHHLPGPTLPPATAVLDPQRPDCTYPYKELSGCGVAFKLLQALADRLTDAHARLLQLSELVAISIAGDIVPITGENRVLAYYGLRQLAATERPGLRMLMAESGRERDRISISDIVFGIGPMINAAGRLADADAVVRLLLTDDEQLAGEYAQVLRRRNDIRREFDQRSAQEAGKLLSEDVLWPQRRTSVVYQPHWHAGVIGIVAARLAADCYRPTVVLTRSGEKLVGSARAQGDFDLHLALEQCRDLLLSFGGHTHAAGLSLRPADLPFFQDRFEAAARLQLGDEPPSRPITIAAPLALRQITPNFYRLLHQFAPFGPGNPNPVFMASQVEDTGASRALRGNHLKLSLRQADSPVFSGIAFNAGHLLADIGRRRHFSICFSVTENTWRNESRLELMVKDIDTTGEKYVSDGRR